MIAQLTLEEVKAHIQTPLTVEMAQYAREVVFKDYRYFFTTGKRKHKTGYCTYCGIESPAGTDCSHNGITTCPVCGSKCIVKAAGVHRKSLWDQAYFTYYRKSAIDPSVIVAVGIYAVQDFSGDYRGVEPRFIDKVLYVFRPGIGGTAYTRTAYYSHEMIGVPADSFYGGHYIQLKTVKSQANRGNIANMPAYCSWESIAQAVEGTPFRWSGWENYKQPETSFIRHFDDMTAFFDLFSRYPSIEYLTKLGFCQLVKSRINGHGTYGAVNWRGQTLMQVLRLTKADLAEIKQSKINLSPSALRILQIGRQDGSNFSLAEAQAFTEEIEIDYQTFSELRKYGRLRRIRDYLIKQREDKEDHRNRYNRYSVVSDYRDYLADCAKLGLDLTQESVVYPRNLHQAHQNTIAQIKIQVNEILNRRVQAQAEKLKGHCFADGDLLIRPAESSGELIAEGKALSHCVGSYAESYAKGRIGLYFIRRAADPDEPYFTVEVRNGKIAQCRGLRNCDPTEEVQAFLDAFAAEILKVPKNEELEEAV